MNPRPFIYDITKNFFFRVQRKKLRKAVEVSFPLTRNFNSFIYPNAVVLMDDDSGAFVADGTATASAYEYIDQSIPFMTAFIDAVNENIELGRAMMEPSRLRAVAGRTVGLPPIAKIDDYALEDFPFDPASIFKPIETYGRDAYSWAWWREVFQNSVDAIKKRERFLIDNGYGSIRGQMDIEYQEHPDYNVIKVIDNGIGMTKSTLFQALLSFGGSTKTHRPGSTGGFGKAKELIFTPWLRFDIQTTAYDPKRDAVVRTSAFGQHFRRQRMIDASEEILAGEGPKSPEIGTVLTVYMGREEFRNIDSDTGEVYTRVEDYRVDLLAIQPVISRSYVPDLTVTVKADRTLLEQIDEELASTGKIKLNKGPKIKSSANQNPLDVLQLENANLEVYVDKRKKKKRAVLKADDARWGDSPEMDIPREVTAKMLLQEEIFVRQNGLYMFSLGSQPEAVKGVVRIEGSGDATKLFDENRQNLKYNGWVNRLINTLSTDGEFGLKLKRDAFEFSYAGTDISQSRKRITEDVALEGESRLNSKLFDLFSREGRQDEFSNLIDKSLVEYSYEGSTSRILETADDAEARRALLSTLSGDLLELLRNSIQQADQVAGDFGTPGFALDSMLRGIPENTEEALKLPVRVPASQFYFNQFWAPQITYYSNMGPDLVPAEYWLKDTNYPEKYPYLILAFWTECCRLAASAIGVDLRGVSTGYAFSWDMEGDIALGLYHPNRTTNGESLLINPVITDAVSFNEFDQPTRFKHKRRYALSRAADRNFILAIAIHEVTHLQGYKYHNDKFAAAMTYNMGEVFPQASRSLGTIYKNIVNKYDTEVTPYVGGAKGGTSRKGGSAYVPELLVERKLKRGRKRKFTITDQEYQDVIIEVIRYVDHPQEFALQFTYVNADAAQVSNPFFVTIALDRYGDVADMYLYNAGEYQDGVKLVPVTPSPDLESILESVAAVIEFYARNRVLHGPGGRLISSTRSIGLNELLG